MIVFCGNTPRLSVRSLSTFLADVTGTTVLVLQGTGDTDFEMIRPKRASKGTLRFVLSPSIRFLGPWKEALEEKADPTVVLTTESLEVANEYGMVSMNVDAFSVEHLEAIRQGVDSKQLDVKWPDRERGHSAADAIETEISRATSVVQRMHPLLYSFPAERRDEMQVKAIRFLSASSGAWTDSGSLKLDAVMRSKEATELRKACARFRRNNNREEIARDFPSVQITDILYVTGRAVKLSRTGGRVLKTPDRRMRR